MANGDFRHAMLNAIRQSPDQITQGVGRMSQAKNFLKTGAGKLAVGELFTWLLAQKALDVSERSLERGIVREGIQKQSALATPENLYYSASLPGAQAGAEQAKQALMATLSGGVLGPSLARGETLIGG